MLSHLIYTGFIMKYSVYKEPATLRTINPAVNRLKLHTPAGFQDHPVWNGPTAPPQTGGKIITVCHTC